jgi:hypothetical protein
MAIVRSADRVAQQWHDRSSEIANDHNVKPAVNKPFVDLIRIWHGCFKQEHSARELIQSAAGVYCLELIQSTAKAGRCWCLSAQSICV